MQSFLFIIQFTVLIGFSLSFSPSQLSGSRFVAQQRQSKQLKMRPTMVKIFIDDTENGGRKESILKKNLLHLSVLNKDNRLEYIQGSRTYDTLRYSHHLPLTFMFTDKLNVKWEVTLESESDTVTMCIPMGTEIMWFGSNEPVRTGCDAQTDWAEVEFHFEPESFFHSNEVRIQLSGYKDVNKKEWAVDSQRWREILDFAKEGTEITGAVVDQVAKVAAISEGVPASK